MLKIKKIKEKIYLIFLLTLIFGNCNILCFANITSIQSLQELFNKHDIEKIESDLKDFSLKDRLKIKDLTKNNLVTLYKDNKTGIKYVEKYFDFESLNEHNENKLSSDNEFAAYAFSKNFKLNLVPPTVKFVDIKNPSNYYVRQYYFEDGFAIDAESKKFLESIPSSKKQDYSSKNTPLVIFDYLLGNSDRNFNNYIISKNGSIIAFDHEFIFRYYFKDSELLKKITLQDFYTFFSDKEIYDNFMNTNWEKWCNENLSKIFLESDLKIKKIFLERIDNIKKQASEFVSQNPEKFFQEAQKFYHESLETKKKIFTYLPPKVPPRPKKYPIITIPVNDNC